MKTADLIALLSQDAAPLGRGPAWRRLFLGLALGGAVTLAAVVFWLRCQPLIPAAGQAWFWMKAIYSVLLTIAAVACVRRLATPGARLGGAPRLAVLTVAAMAVLGAGQLILADPADRLDVWLGRTWQVCSPLILLLSAPIFVGITLVLRTLAPTRLAAAGAASGFASGALAAALYGLHCPEQAAAFVVTWYSLGIAAATLVGALAGRWLLRW